MGVLVVGLVRSGVSDVSANTGILSVIKRAGERSRW